MAVRLTNQKFTTIDANGNRFIDVGIGSADTDGVNYSQIKDLNGNVYTLHEGTDASNTDTFQRYYLSLDGGTTHVGTPVAVGADEITAVTTQRNDAGQTRAQWMTGEGFTAIAEQDYAIGDTFFYVNDANERTNYVVLVAFTAVLDSDATVRDAYITGLVTANTIAATSTANFVADARYALTTISLAKDLQLLAQDNYVAMDVATENGNNYHFDLLRFQGVNGRLVLQTDRLVTRLEQIGGQYPSATSASNTDFDQDFMVVQGSVWYFEDNLWLYEGATPLAITSDSTTFSNRPQSTVSTWVRLHNINWNQNITYYQGDVVAFNSRFYTVVPTTIAGSSSNANPANDPTRWNIISPGVPDGTATGEILVWDNATSQYRAVRLLINGVDTNGATEAENFILDGIIDDPATRATTRAWQETFLLQKFATLAEFEDPVAGSSMYLTAQDGTNDPGPYTYGTEWEPTGGSAILVNSNEVEDPNFVTGPGHSATETYYSPDFAVNGSNVSVEIDTDELGVDLGIAAIRSQISAIEDELSEAQEYVYSQDAAYVDVFLTKRSDELGTFTNTIVVFYSNFDPATNIFTTYARLTDDEWNAFTALVADGDTVVGFGPSFNNFVPFQLLSWAPNGHGTVETGSATYQFELKMIETGAAYTGAGAIADATHKTQFESWATSSPGDTGHPGNTLFYYAEQDTNIASIGHAIANHLLNVNTVVGATARTAGAATLEGITIGGTPWNILNDEKDTILDNFEVKTGTTTVTSIIPDEDTRIVLDTYETGGAPEDGEWYWRQQNTNPGSGAAATIFNPTTWADLADRPDGGETDSTLWRQLMCQAEAVDAAKFNTIRAGVGQFDAGTTTVDDADLGDFFVAGYDNATGEVDLNNWAVIRAISTPDNATNNDVRFRIHSITNSAGVPPNGDAAGAANQSLGIVISHLSDTVTTTTTTRTANPSFQENLDIIGNVRIGNEDNTHTLDVTGDTTIGGDLTVTGTVVGLEGETIQDWPASYTVDFTVNQGDYWEVNNRLYRRDGANVLIDDTASLTANTPAIGANWTLVTERSSIMAGTGITVSEQVVSDTNVFTVATDIVLNRAEVTIPRSPNEILRTDRVEDIVTFVGDALTHGNSFSFVYSANNNPTSGMSFIDSNTAFNTTLDFSEVTHVRVLNSDVNESAFLREVRNPFMVTWGTNDNPDQVNWALLRIPDDATFDTIGNNGFSTTVNTGNTRQLPVEILDGEFGGTVQTTPGRASRNGDRNNGIFTAVNILRFVEPFFDENTGISSNRLSGDGVFNLEQTGIITEIASGNINTQFGTLAGGISSATVHHQPMQSMAYLALQFNSIFQGVRGVTPGFAAINDTFLPAGTTIADFTYIEYLSTYDGTTQNVTFVDRVRNSNGDTTTRKFDNAKPALFNVEDESEVIFPR